MESSSSEVFACATLNEVRGSDVGRLSWRRCEVLRDLD